jgi:hypothetical protein
MKTFRFAVRTLMAVVAVAAILLWAFKMRQHSLYYEAKAAQYASKEQYHITVGDGAAGIMTDGRIWSKEELVAFFRALRIKYERAARFPWLAVEPDPAEPHPLAGFDIRAMGGR